TIEVGLDDAANLLHAQLARRREPGAADSQARRARGVVEAARSGGRPLRHVGRIAAVADEVDGGERDQAIGLDDEAVLGRRRRRRGRRDRREKRWWWGWRRRLGGWLLRDGEPAGRQNASEDEPASGKGDWSRHGTCV